MDQSICHLNPSKEIQEINDLLKGIEGEVLQLKSGQDQETQPDLPKIQQAFSTFVERVRNFQAKFQDSEGKLLNQNEQLKDLYTENDILKNIVLRLSEQVNSLEKYFEEANERSFLLNQEAISLRHERGVLINSLGSLQGLESKLEEIERKTPKNGDENKGVSNLEARAEISELQRVLQEQNRYIDNLGNQLQAYSSYKERYEKMNERIKDYSQMIELLKEENRRLKGENFQMVKSYEEVDLGNKRSFTNSTLDETPTIHRKIHFPREKAIMAYDESRDVIFEEAKELQLYQQYEEENKHGKYNEITIVKRRVLDTRNEEDHVQNGHGLEREKVVEKTQEKKEAIFATLVNLIFLIFITLTCFPLAFGYFMWKVVTKKKSFTVKSYLESFKMF